MIIGIFQHVTNLPKKYHYYYELLCGKCYITGAKVAGCFTSPGILFALAAASELGSGGKFLQVPVQHTKASNGPCSHEKPVEVAIYGTIYTMLQRVNVANSRWKHLIHTPTGAWLVVWGSYRALLAFSFPGLKSRVDLNYSIDVTLSFLHKRVIMHRNITVIQTYDILWIKNY